jgi:hypothetical protein
VALFYEDVGKLVAHGVVDERLIVGSYGPNIVNMWEVLAPYFYRTARPRPLDDIETPGEGRKVCRGCGPADLPA